MQQNNEKSWYQPEHCYAMEIEDTTIAVCVRSHSSDSPATRLSKLYMTLQTPFSRKK